MNTYKGPVDKATYNRIRRTSQRERMIECPTCGNEVFRIHDDSTSAGPNGHLEHVIECTKCLAAWTLGFEAEDEEVRTVQ